MLYGIGCDLCEIAHLEKSLPAHTLQLYPLVYWRGERAGS